MFFFPKVSRRGIPYPIVNPLGSIYYTNKISVPSLYWCCGYELPRISKSRRHLLYLPPTVKNILSNFQGLCGRHSWSRAFLRFGYLAAADVVVVMRLMGLVISAVTHHKVNVISAVPTGKPPNNIDDNLRTMTLSDALSTLHSLWDGQRL